MSPNGDRNSARGSGLASRRGECDIAKLTQQHATNETSKLNIAPDNNARLRGSPEARPRAQRVWVVSLHRSPAWFDPRRRVLTAHAPGVHFPSSPQRRPAFSAQQPPAKLCQGHRSQSSWVERCATVHRSDARELTGTRHFAVAFISPVRHRTPKCYLTGLEGTRAPASGTVRSPRPVS